MVAGVVESDCVAPSSAAVIGRRCELGKEVVQDTIEHLRMTARLVHIDVKRIVVRRPD